MSCYKSSFLILAVFVIVGMTGCTQGNKDTGTTVKYDATTVEASKKEAERKMEEIKNNPRIPEAQKQAIMSRMRNMQGQQGGEASVLSKQGSSGTTPK